MPPSLSFYNGGNRPKTNTIFTAKTPIRILTTIVYRTNVPYDGFIKLGEINCGTSTAATFRYHIRCIIGLRAEEQVTWSDTDAIITLMEYV